MESVTNDPDGTVERDHFRDHLAQRAEPDALAMYVGCPSRLKLLGMHIGSLTPQGHDESFETTAHEDDLSR